MCTTKTTLDEPKKGYGDYTHITVTRPPVKNTLPGVCDAYGQDDV